MIPKEKLYYISVMFSLNAGEREKFGDGPVSQPERRYAPYQSLLQKTDKIMCKPAIE